MSVLDAEFGLPRAAEDPGRESGAVEGGEVGQVGGVLAHLHREPAEEADLRHGDARRLAFADQRLGLGRVAGDEVAGLILAEELGDDQWEIQRQIVRVFDPAGILNPGKVFTS